MSRQPGAESTGRGARSGGARPDGWTGRLGFMLATIGSAVGIGSIWKFPYEVGSNGGSAFLLFYLLGLALIVVPLMFAEFAIGRRGRSDPSGSIAAVAAACGASRRWTLVGVLGVVTGFLVLSFYSVIGGWTLGYAIQMVHDGLPGVDPRAVAARFDAFLASPWRLALLHAVFMGATAAIVARGVSGGIESAVKVLMPLLLVLMVLLAGYSVAVGDLPATLSFLFRLDTSHLDAGTALEALGLGFFSIGVGLGLMITYAAYSGAEISLKEVAVGSVLADTAISFLAGFAVFPIVFAHGLDPASGPGLVFVTLPLAFAQMPYGTLAAGAFFVLLFVAALASAISMLELIVAMLTRRLGLGRLAATAIAASACFAAGIATVLSFNLWADWRPLGGIDRLADASFFDLLDMLTSDLLLPIGGLLIALFAGWAAPRQLLVEELRLGKGGASLLRALLRWIAPAAIVAVTASALLG
ncbi:sodium-dependent transporter [Burkholderiaceae bacterium FT117]|uniref:sodium-dependent transporter n=1 Tax=Zeimonas sediminis TaxID=2944268 RepID=UPI0023431AE7|nr:sodium-dependent transporter [Zeimonas sediminis]MCM5569706.1 sodium-dependent transporter [Zeimonas sediminis]